MTNKTEGALEHGEHAAHAAHDPFDRLVTMSIAIIAALLAAVTMLGHRAHNETLQLQIKSNDALTAGSNKWNHYQSKKNRQYEYLTANRRWRMDLKDPRLTKEQAAAWESANAKDAKFWTDKAGVYEEDTEKLFEEATEFGKEANEKQQEAMHLHHLGVRYDFAELGIELGLVLCSLAVLTKKRNFWYGGMGCAGLGVLLMLWGVVEQYLVHHH
jgi:Domain of unknown function (DUF4337)